jgi:HK97 family phage prohead protease
MTRFKSADFAAQMPAEGTVEGYAATFDREPDSYGDVIAKGAFARTLSEWSQKGQPIPLLYGHNTDDPEYNIGRVTSAVEDERGLLVEAEFDPDNPKAQYVRKLVREGRLYQFSFAYDVRDAAPVELDGGAKANELRDLDLFEVSLVQIPANQHATVEGVKERGAKYGRRNSKSDEQAIRQAIDLLQSVLDDERDEIDDGADGASEGGEAAHAKGREDGLEEAVEYAKAILEALEVVA